jgi:hypothetical protein
MAGLCAAGRSDNQNILDQFHERVRVLFLDGKDIRLLIEGRSQLL